MSKSKGAVRAHPFSSISEAELKAYQGKSLLNLWLEDPVRVDLGECIFSGVVDFIPSWIHPNQITVAGLFCMLVLMGVSLAIPPAFDDENRATLCIVCAMLVLSGMTCDSLDGLHARATRQCSTVGAVLDHWFDSITTAITGAALALALDAPRPVISFGIAGAILVFNLQLIVYNHLREFPRLAGVEAQLLVAGAFFFVALTYVGDFTTYHGPIAWLLAAFEVVWVISYSVSFTKKYNLTMWKIFLGSTLSLSVQVLMHVNGDISTAECILLMIVSAMRINGDIVLYSESKVVMNDINWSMLIGSALIFAESRVFHAQSIAFVRFLAIDVLSVDTMFNADSTLWDFTLIHPISWPVTIVLAVSGVRLFFTNVQKAHQFDLDKRKNS
jgi:phosphatidylglycerophosphate synthase